MFAVTFAAEWTGSFKSDPTSEIPNKYIHDAFLMIYFSFLLLLFFHFFDASKELIRDSQRLQFCSFVRLQQKSHDDITKRAAVEKEPQTLE